MLGSPRDYWSKVHEDSEWQSENQIICPGRGEGVAASSEGRQEYGTSVSYPHLCVGKREGRCEETVTRAPCTTASAVSFSHLRIQSHLVSHQSPKRFTFHELGLPLEPSAIRSYRQRDTFHALRLTFHELGLPLLR